MQVFEPCSSGLSLYVPESRGEWNPRFSAISHSGTMQVMANHRVDHAFARAVEGGHGRIWQIKRSEDNRKTLAMSSFPEISQWAIPNCWPTRSCKVLTFASASISARSLVAQNLARNDVRVDGCVTVVRHRHVTTQKRIIVADETTICR
jgi:hypothetical protein